MADACFPIAGGVPGDPGAPNWFDDSVDKPRRFDNGLDDPRWRGAFSHAFGDGTEDTVSFRALYYSEPGEEGRDGMYLSWIVKVDPTGPDDSHLYVGLGAGPGSAAIIVGITIETASSETAEPPPVYSKDVFVKAAAGSDFPIEPSSEADPPWIADRTRAWVNYTPTGALTISWAVEMFVPFGEELSPEAAHSVQLSTANEFKMWYAAYLGYTDVDGDGDDEVVEVTWPGTPGIEAGFPSLSDFVDVGAGDPACTATGVSIEVANIGTKNVDGTARPSASRIQVDLVNDPPLADTPDRQNRFFAIPTFPAGTSNDHKEAILAGFRLANWGSHVGDLTADSWAPIPGGDDVDFDLADNECSFVWPTPADLVDPLSDSRQWIDDIRNGVKTTHQCMLVELRSNHPDGETFVKSSVYRNMDFVNASVFERGAEVSVIGLTPISEQPRDVYLYVETRNMPEFIPPPEDDLKRVTDRRLFTAEVFDNAVAFDKRLDFDRIARYWPTYRVHAYHDTGRTTKLLDGKERHILRAQTSFGYFVDHEGALYGWKHQLEGAEELPPRPNFYRLRVPNNGFAKIKTRIEADETPGCRYVLVLAWRALMRILGG